MKKFGQIMPIGSKSLHRKHIYKISNKEGEILNSTFLFSEVQTCFVLGFDTESPYSLQSISVNYVDDLKKLIPRTNSEYYLTDLFQQLRKTSKV